MMGDRHVRSINANVISIVAISTVLQCVALLAGDGFIDEGTSGRHVFSTVEMALVAAAIVGVLAYFTNHDPAVSAYSSGLMLLYTMMLSVLAGSTLWVVSTYGWGASCLVVIGCLLAPVADALIGNFWIYRNHYPTVEHLNWIVYFTSLAMIQQMPFFIAGAGAPSR